MYDQVGRRGFGIIAAISATGWKCGMALNVETVGLMFGLVGIGYGMLCLTGPGRVPAVLALSC
jgi:lantibiotic modifying enzyme